ncbi:MAG: transcriptional regulator [Rhizobiaceae bacterium MnEN-MB40S]|nr:MAG: transcriptional regulator [Rhizobiaceae bacterium MnEN-MB40S]
MSQTEIRQDDPKAGASDGIVDILKTRFAGFSPQLRKAARFAIDNPSDVAVYSMRTLAKKAGVQHNAMVRLARELGFDGYDQFRDLFRDYVTRGSDARWLSRAQSIRERFPVGSNTQILGEHVLQELENLQQTFGEGIAEKLNDAVSRLRGARKIYVLGLRSMFPLAYYFHYTCRMFDARSVLLTGLGGALADDLRTVGSKDVLLVFSYRPYARDAIAAVEFVRERKGQVIAITDSEVSPVVTDAGVSLIVRNGAISLFSSLLPAFAVAQIIATMLLTEGGREAMQRLEETQEQLDLFNVYME